MSGKCDRQELPGKYESSSLVYVGDSMYPTLKPLDTVYFKPCGEQWLKRGDVIVFKEPGHDNNIIHRVASVSAKRIETRGDNCMDADPWVLCESDVIGRVAFIRRDGRYKAIYGGRAGRICLAAVSAATYLMQAALSLVAIPYHMVARITIFRGFLLTRMKPRLIYFNRPQGAELHMYRGGFRIGVYNIKKNRWRIRPLFRPLADEKILADVYAGVGFVWRAANGP